MQSLREVQQAFGRVLAGGEAGALASVISANGIDPAARLHIYRNNHRENSLAALRSVYPVIERLVDAAYFRQTALAYLLAHPSRSGNLDGLGDRFPQFLAEQFGHSEYSYLADVARLEWCCHEVAMAPESAPLDAEKLRALPPDRYPSLVFHLHPAVRLLESRFPVLRIWRANQPDSDASERIDLGSPERVLVTRVEQRIELRWLERTEFEFLAAAGRGASFAECTQRAAECGDFDPSAALLRLVSSQILVDFSAG